MIQSTKAQILMLLKRSGGATVEELAAKLGVASMTVRQHLANLERDDLVDAVEVRRATGRPHHRYRLTPKGEETFPRRYDRLASLLLQEFSEIDPSAIAGLDAEERTRVVLARLADRLAEQYVARVAGKPFEQRVAEVTQILQEENGFAEYRRVDDGFELRDLNCAYRKLIPFDTRVCQWHLRFLTRLLGDNVTWASEDCGGVDCCRYLILEPAPTRVGALA